MSRPSTSSQRNLSLTEELEKLEQSITLTLQEIDHNFSRAHRIVTSSILPVVEDYAKHSEEVWEGSKFWKQFFEASANVSLNGYEEPSGDEETITETTMTEETTSQATPSSSYASPPQTHGRAFSPSSAQEYRYTDDENSTITLSAYSPDASSATPRPRAQQGAAQPTNVAAYASPYEALRREIQGPPAPPSTSETPSSTLPSTPRNQTLDSPSPSPTPFAQQQAPSATARHKPARTPANDGLLHRVLDKNYRLQATPHTQTRLPRRGEALGAGAAAGTAARTPVGSRRAAPRQQQQDDLDSSPMEAAPELHTHLFETPGKARRVPGVSVLTPVRKGVGGGALGAAGTGPRDGDAGAGKGKEVLSTGWDSDSDEEGLPEGMSPPKTMQFHIPQSKLLRTPAREASKRIVDDILRTAGDPVGDLEEESSPSLVGRAPGLDGDDTF